MPAGPAADEAAAREARERYRNGPMPAVRADPEIAALLQPGEAVVAVHPSVVLERRTPKPESAAPRGPAGELHVTSRRLLLIGRDRLSIDLEEILEVGLSGEWLLLVLREGRGVALRAAQPRLLRVEIAAARAAARA